jgi:hypothetical protein
MALPMPFTLEAPVITATLPVNSPMIPSSIDFETRAADHLLPLYDFRFDQRIFSNTSLCIPAGLSIPNHSQISQPGAPDSASVGTSGIDAEPTGAAHPQGEHQTPGLKRGVSRNNSHAAARRASANMWTATRRK